MTALAGPDSARALHEGVERLRTHLSTGIETLEGMEHIHVVVEARLYGMRQALRLLLEEARRSHSWACVYPRMTKPSAKATTSGRPTESRRRHQLARFREPAQHQRRGDEDAECVPHPPRPPRYGEQRPWDLAADRQES